MFTGLKDKRGVDIFEGDILSANYYPFIDEGKQNYVAIVEWIFAQFQIVLQCVNKDKRGISSGVNDCLQEGEHYEVIGTIHDKECV